MVEMAKIAELEPGLKPSCNYAHAIVHSGHDVPKTETLGCSRGSLASIFGCCGGGEVADSHNEFFQDKKCHVVDSVLHRKYK